MLNFGLGWLLPGDNGIGQTVNTIRKLVRFALRDNPRVRLRAEQIIESVSERDQVGEVTAVFKWVLAHYKYTNDPVDLEFIKDPNVIDQEIVAKGFFRGDCDDVVTYLAALLWSIGYPVRFVTISVDGQGPDYRHIYLEAFLSSSGKWMPLEGTARQFPPGWSASADRVKTYEL